jgi:hypothetical protein
MKNTFKPFAILCLILFAASKAGAQTKVFKEVAEGISSEFEVILQDDKLVGYLGFTQLEQASEDSFNYRISIMDENLNDIGAVNFREQKLSLRGVSFEQDVLCLAYLKSNFQDVPYHSKKQFKDVQANAKSSLFTQFVSLDGKIKATNTVALQITPKAPDLYPGCRICLLFGRRAKEDAPCIRCVGKTTMEKRRPGCRSKRCRGGPTYFYYFCALWARRNSFGSRRSNTFPMCCSIPRGWRENGRRSINTTVR